MLIKKPVHIVFFTAFCILLNDCGGLLAALWDLPAWADSFGTVIAAYAMGPVCGAIVGAAGTILSGLRDGFSWFYLFNAVVVAVLVGDGKRRGRFDSVFGAMTVASMVTVMSVLLSVPVNLLLFGGNVNNLWGSGVFAVLRERGVPLVIASFAGQFYVEFVDKAFTLMAVYFLCKWLRLLVRPKAGKPKTARLRTSALFLVLPASLAVFAFHAKAEEPGFYDYVQTVFSSNNGLPCGEANDIAATQDGVLWIGTYAGLYRYNGDEFHWMDEYDGVRNVNCLYADDGGRLWIGTNDNGLAVVVDEVITAAFNEDDGLPSNSVRSVVKGTDGYYYVGTTAGMAVFSLEDGLTMTTTIPSVIYADHASADASGRVAAVTVAGELFILMNRHVVRFLPEASEGEQFASCVFAPDGRLYAGTAAGRVIVFDVKDGLTEERAIQCGALRSVNCLLFADDGNVFLTADNGIGYLDGNSVYHAVNSNQFNASIDNMIVDFQGNFWFASSRLGLLRLTKSNFTDVYGSLGMENKVVNAICARDGTLYIGTDTGLDAVTPACTARVEDDLTALFTDVRVRCLLTDSRGHFWVCTYGKGLFEIAPDGGVTVYNAESGTSGDWVRSVIELADGTVLAASDTGLRFMREGTVVGAVTREEGLTASMILTLSELPDGTILAGSDGDGLAVIKDGKVSRVLTRADGLSSGVIMRSVVDPESGGVFLVTSNALCYMDADYHVRLLDNFPYFNNYDVRLIADGEVLFVSGSAGIYVVNKDELLDGTEELSYELLDAGRGLTRSLTANAWSYSDSEGNLFLPCDSGMIRINVDRYNAGGKTYRLRLKELQIDDEHVPLAAGEVIDVPRTASKIEFIPEVINYTIEEPYVRYRLDGFDTQWTTIPAGKLSSVSYTNVPAGSYTFDLELLDSAGRDAVVSRTYPVVKRRAFYDSDLFTLYLSVVAMLAVAWVTWFIVRKQVQRTINFQEKELAFAKQQVQMGNETILAIAKTVDAKDENTSQHSQRVSHYAVLIAKKLGFSDEECENLRKAALLHDLGKIAIPDRILNKPAKLTDEEYAVMKSHVTKGAEILKDFTLIDHVVEGALYHHERYDGRGYVSGLKGEEIPIYGRIIGVADAFDAMTANRVYRQKLDFQYVIDEMKRCRGTQFDPQMDDILLELIEDGEINIEELYKPRETPAENGEKPRDDGKKDGENA